MNRYITTISALLLATAAAAQDYSKMSWQLQQLVHGNGKTGNAKCFTGNKPRKVLMLVQGEESALRGHCIRHQGDIHIASVLLSDIAGLSEDARIKRMQMNLTRPTALNCQAAKQVGANRIWSGEALPQAFDGTGVVVGDVDIAHDYTHPAFRSLKDGRLRIARVWDMIDVKEGDTPDDGSRFPLGTFLNDTTEILRKQCSTDSEQNYHGTHTAATAAGSGWGTDLSGMAPEAELYLTSTTCDENTKYIPESLQQYYSQEMQMLAFQNIFDYADSIGKPCVINYSMGSEQDITDSDALTEQYMERMLGPGRILVASAGNNGVNLYNYCRLEKKGETCGGLISMRFGSDSNVNIRVKTNGTLTLSIKAHDADGNTTSERRVKLDCIMQDDEPASPSGTLEPYEFNTFADGETLDSLGVTVYPGVCGLDKDYIGYDIFLTQGRKSFYDGRYTIEAVNEEEAVTELFAQTDMVRAFTAADGTTLAGWRQGGTIVSPGSLPSVVTVGATSWHNSVKGLDGKDIRYPAGEGGERASFSSVGPSLNGLMKPDVMAPGNLLSSAMNSYTKEPDASRYTAETTTGGRTYHYIAESGTSMSTPVVTGAIALWLQADPTLTTQRVKEILARTATHPDPALSYPNNYYGHGEIDAYAGLLEVLGMTGVEGLSHTAVSRATVRPAADGSISITLAQEAAAPPPCRLYTSDGKLVKSVALKQGETAYRIDAEGLKGIVAVQIDGYGSTLVRL